jgi:glycosyltransferase involved in cell wall biosynthesis
MISYNHEAYIAKAIESILSQVTTFNIEIVIGDDNSSDNTQNIIETYKKRFPNIIKPRYNKKNIGMMPNMLETLRRCKGEYIALCEGDDYWIDINKLQIQVDYLINNPQASMCFTDRIEINDKGIKIRDNIYDSISYTTDDIIMGFIPPTQTIVFRNVDKINTLIENHLDSPSGDRILAFFCSKIGNIHRIPVITAAYRQSGKGVWNSYNKQQQFFISLDRYIQFHQTLGIPINNQHIHKRINGSVIYLIRKYPIGILNNLRRLLSLKKKYGIKSHFNSYLLNKISK